MQKTYIIHEEENKESNIYYNQHEGDYDTESLIKDREII